MPHEHMKVLTTLNLEHSFNKTVIHCWLKEVWQIQSSIYLWPSRGLEVLLQLLGDPVQFLLLPSGTADESQSFLNPDQSQQQENLSHFIDCVVVFGCCPGCWNHKCWKPEQRWRIHGKIVSIIVTTIT